ncbi:2og-fe oxygenase protein [Fusarium avenaceum]|nr:2og-fe oxygenase protein [Fusarium avenaceum]
MAVELPLVDLDGYINPKSAGDRERVIAEVREACAKFGFFQAKGHGISMDLQKGLLHSLDTFFDMPQEEKRKLSFLKNVSRRGYEESGMSLRDGDALPDSKEGLICKAFYIGREDPVVEHSGFYGPNVWPPLPESQFRQPVWDYYQATQHLGHLIWEILLQGLGHPTSLLDAFAKKPMVVMKMIRYPPLASTAPGQFGVGAHTDFGGVTVLLQEPGRHGLEVWLEEQEAWVPVKALEDVYVINCGDMIMNWSGGQFKSARHRVINKAADESRLSCATFYHGDLFATNPLNPDDPNKATVGQLLVKRFRNQFSMHAEAKAEVGAQA